MAEPESTAMRIFVLSVLHNKSHRCGVLDPNGTLSPLLFSHRLHLQTHGLGSEPPRGVSDLTDLPAHEL